MTKVVASHHQHAALKSDGSVVLWGNKYCAACSPAPLHGLRSGVVDIVAASSALAALKEDGTVLAWGERCCGGDTSSITAALKQVASLHAADDFFVARKFDSSVVSWGRRIGNPAGSPFMEPWAM